nr:MAG TPA: lysin [Caudoviricetes sp.]
MKLFVICGHGAGDPGACANGYEEAERVRVLGKKIKELGGSNVTLGDVNRDYYADNGISSLNLSKDTQIIELHMDSASASARGAHIIIWHEFQPDDYDNALASFLCGLFPGRSTKIAKRSDLANPARAAAKGYGYRLAECGFISNKEDLEIFNNNIEKIAKGILEAFGISASGASSSNKPSAGKPSSGSSSSSKKTISQIAKEVINGEWGNGDARKKKLAAAGYDYDAVQKEVNKQLGVSTSAGSGNASSKKKTVTLPASASSWRVYPTNKAPVVGNECGYLYPSKFGGLTYDILATPQTDVVTIKTRDYGKVNIYVAKSTGAIIK